MTNTPHPPDPTARMPQTHELKCWPAFFVAVQSWDKMFEIRHNDRSFKVGDVLWLREWNAENYTGESVKRTISYITDFPSGLRAGYVCMGLAYPDLPAMAQRVMELESFQINFQHAMNIEREEAKAERDKLTAQVEEQSQLIEKLTQLCLSEIDKSDELRKALAEAMELIRQADADPHIAYSPEWGAKATKFVLVAGTEQAG